MFTRNWAGEPPTLRKIFALQTVKILFWRDEFV